MNGDTMISGVYSKGFNPFNPRYEVTVIRIGEWELSWNEENLVAFGPDRQFDFGWVPNPSDVRSALAEAIDSVGSLVFIQWAEASEGHIKDWEEFVKLTDRLTDSGWE